jgi:hypothetical protein
MREIVHLQTVSLNKGLGCSKWRFIAFDVWEQNEKTGGD